ncbi:hypothetical protein [endosymbiont GvMRE of Glomus versiforme]|uniref:hypothetical protein n=1 Tax=endosymbiont GvMRE of Glomus versiforme TaxID=2039283 RepID=UPI000EC59FE1|nr:hypothetical protein [endosymbiont GvMRE of Glomus versiforme]RHZ37206.1 hypothetical protein GvMRE_I1g488 [endosymbiont GvMRE of Glomus versiforme]
MPKDRDYWKEYNQKRKGYLAQKVKEWKTRKKLTGIQPTENLQSGIQLNQNEKGIQPLGIQPKRDNGGIQPLSEKYTTEAGIQQPKREVDEKEISHVEPKKMSNLNLKPCSNCSESEKQLQEFKEQVKQQQEIINQLKTQSQENAKQITTYKENIKNLQSRKYTRLENAKENNQSCLLNHITFAELFQQLTEKVKKDYQEIYQKRPETARKCFDCHNYERNYQIMTNLLEKYWAKSKKLEKGEKCE